MLAKARWARAAGWIALVAVLAAWYVFVISAGRWSNWPGVTNYLNAQADGFRAGHLYTTVPTPPKLLTLKDPLAQENMRYWRWDYSYANGHIYTYWGLFPAALLAAGKSLFDIRHGVDDQAMVFVFMMVRLGVGTLLILAMAARRAPRPAAWAVATAVVVFAVVNPVGYLLARPAVYEAAIGGGSCFLLVALYAAFRALFAADEMRACRWIVAASVALAVAGACRVSLFPAGAGLLGMLAAVPLFEPGAAAGARWRKALARAPCAAGPFGLLAMLHLYLNYVRFDSWTDFGQRHQMGKIFTTGARFIPANLWSYLIRRIDTVSCGFPFFKAEWHEKGHVPQRDHLPGWVPIPPEYHGGEPSAGIITTAPFVLLALVLLVPAWRRIEAEALDASGRDPADRRRWSWMVALLGAAALGGALPDLFASASTMRYVADFAPPLVLLAVLGGWRLLAVAARRPGRAGAARAGAASAVAVLALATVLIGVAFSFTGYFDYFKLHNPTLHAKLAKLALCGV